MASLVSVFAAMRLTNVPSNLHTLCACAPERFSAQVRYALPTLRSPPRRDEGWVHHAIFCKMGYGHETRIRSRHFLMSRTAFEKEKELTDRALKLAEVGKPKSNWELQGILRVAAFVLGLLVGK